MRSALNQTMTRPRLEHAIPCLPCQVDVKCLLPKGTISSTHLPLTNHFPSRPPNGPCKAASQTFQKACIFQPGTVGSRRTGPQPTANAASKHTSPKPLQRTVSNSQRIHSFNNTSAFVSPCASLHWRKLPSRSWKHWPLWTRQSPWKVRVLLLAPASPLPAQ